MYDVCVMDGRRSFCTTTATYICYLYNYSLEYVSGGEAGGGDRDGHVDCCSTDKTGSKAPSLDIVVERRRR